MRPHLCWRCRGARQHERLNTIIKEARLRRYFPFERLIQVVAVAGGAAPRMIKVTEAGQHVFPAPYQESAAVRLSAHFQKRLFFLELEWQARAHLKRKRPRRFDAGGNPQLAVDQPVALLKQTQQL